MDTIVGEWQATGRPWHIVFRTDKTMGMSSAGSADPGNTEPNVSALDRGNSHYQDEERQRVFGNVSPAHAKPV